MSEQFIQCLNPDACLPGDAENPLGVCEEEYEGPLCSRCKSGYYKQGAENICSECPVDVKVRYIALTIFMALIVCLIISFSVMSNSLIEIRPNNFIPATIKIFVSYLQLVFVFYRVQRQSLKESSVSRAVLDVQTAVIQEY